MRLAVIFAAALAAAGCVAKDENLQPFVAAAGAYSVMAKPAPTPPSPDSGCVKGCKCNGTGLETSGDGLEKGSCRCPEGCSCKKKKSEFATKSAPVCTTGTCGWPPRNTTR